MMFEQTMLRPAPVRGWAVTLGITGEVVLVGFALAVPVLWPDLLPKAQLMTRILAPVPPLAAVKPVELSPARSIRPFRPAAAALYVPVRIPPVAQIIDDPPLADRGPSVEGGNNTAGSPGAFTNVLDSVVRLAPPTRTAETPVPAPPKPAVAETQRIRVSGTVQAARLLHRVDPVYPALARQARVSGTVELAGVIGADGRIRELHVERGHPLLAPAALEAVRQWVYQPTLLGGTPVEVVTTIDVIFRLN